MHFIEMSLGKGLQGLLLNIKWLPMIFIEMYLGKGLQGLQGLLWLLLNIKGVTKGLPINFIEMSLGKGLQGLLLNIKWLPMNFI